MDWKRRKQIANLVEGILQCNVLNQPPFELVCDIMKRRGIIFEERDENDDAFCGVYIEIGETKIIFVNSNLYEPRKNFTIAHELGHHFLAHPLEDGAIICNKGTIFGRNKPEPEKEADYFAACFLMPENIIKQKRAEYEKNYYQQLGFFEDTQTHDKNKNLVEYLCKFFMVSKEAMNYRLEGMRIEYN